MPRPLRLAGAVLALVPVFALAFATTAAADSGCGAIGKPPCTILRPVPAPSHRSVPADAPACVVVVGGLGSPPNDDFFDPILDHLEVAADGRPILNVRFGHDRGDRYGYDTYGAIDRNAAQLRALVRDLSDECFTIDLLAHSMGGVVADRAFSMGLSSTDGVATYVPLSSPHNGSFAARAIRLGVELDDAFADAASAVARGTGLHDPTSAAVRGLAERRKPRPPRDVATVRPRLVSDLTVLRRDNVDRRYDVREYLPASGAEAEGHGGIVRNARAQNVAVRTIREHRVPPDDRSAAEIGAASLASRTVERYWGGLVAFGGLALASVAIGSAVGGAARDAADAIGEGEGLGGAASAVGGDAAALADRAVDHFSDGIELVRAASEIRTPLPVAALKLVVETVFDR